MEALVVVAKAPEPGRVKTRLVPTLGRERTTALYVCFLRDTFEIARQAASLRPSIVPVLCYAGDESAFEAVNLRIAVRLAQRGADLGDRLGACFSELFERGYDAVVAIGADSPTLAPELVVRAFEILSDERHVVLGPSSDGGYYLIGARRFESRLFESIPWSTDGVLDATRHAAEAAGIDVCLLPEWYDVDTPDELDRLVDELRRTESSALSTRAFLEGYRAPS